MKLKKEICTKLLESKKKYIFVGVCAMAMIVLTMVIFAMMNRDFDAQGYVRATLDQYFQGDVEEISDFVTDNSKAEHYDLYEEQIEDFVENNITSGVEVSQELEQKYIDLCKEIFRTMKYNVKEAKEEKRNEYQVAVQYQPSDVFIRFVENLKTEQQRLLEKAQNVEYTGTKEEINAQMQNEFFINSYELMKSAYQTMEYNEEQTFVFEVKRGDKGAFCIDEPKVSELIIKILRLDEIQD